MSRLCRTGRLVRATGERRLDPDLHELTRRGAAVTDYNIDQVLALLFEWQRAVLAALDPSAPPEDCPAAWLKVLQIGIELDLVTGGWFERWSRQDPARRPDMQCP